MDANHFDALSRALSDAGTRRSLLGRLASLPVLGGLVALDEVDDTAAKERRRRRKQRHKRRKNPGSRKKSCKPQSKGKVCAGTCGPVTSRQTCGTTVDCGSCDCNPSCGTCFICRSGSNTPGTCVVDPEQQGEPCGDAGQVCQVDGTCACQSGGCPDPTPICMGKQCVPCTSNDQCQNAGLGDRCCAGVCRECCGDGDCAGSKPICVSNVCTACSAANPCSTGCCDAVSGACLSDCPTCQTCTGGTCQPDTTLEHTCAGPCASGQWCDSGACADIQATVTLPDCQGLCGSSTQVCGQTVTCPSCSLCISQTGCSSVNTLPEGPAGSGEYCSRASSFACSTNADCVGQAPDLYCSPGTIYTVCTRTCPY